MGCVPYAECLACSQEEHGDAVHILNEDCYYVEKFRDDGQLRGIDFFHRGTDGEACGGYCNILGAGSPKWKVEQSAPLTLSPSVWCKGPGCGGYHGWIRNGQWSPA